ncbi:hypothetical protein [Rickettsia conorii]|nr:hypothetical protein [Rickettsia conorii]
MYPIASSKRAVQDNHSDFSCAISKICCTIKLSLALILRERSGKVVFI